MSEANHGTSHAASATKVLESASSSTSLLSSSSNLSRSGASSLSSSHADLGPNHVLSTNNEAAHSAPSTPSLKPTSLDPELATAKKEFFRRKCLPLYNVLLPAVPNLNDRGVASGIQSSALFNASNLKRKRFMIDFQVALFLGLKSGREVLDKYPHFERRVASSAQKAQLQASPVGDAVLSSILSNRNLGSGPEVVIPRFIPWVQRKDGLRALNFVDVDIHFLETAQVMKELVQLDYVKKEGSTLYYVDEEHEGRSRVWEIEKRDLDLSKYDATSIMASSSPSSSNLPLNPSNNSNAQNTSSTTQNSWNPKLKYSKNWDPSLKVGAAAQALRGSGSSFPSSSSSKKSPSSSLVNPSLSSATSAYTPSSGWKDHRAREEPYRQASHSQSQSQPPSSQQYVHKLKRNFK